MHEKYFSLKRTSFLNLLLASTVFADRQSFIDTDNMFKCLRGYMQSELRLANGERTGQLGGKRKAQLDKYGFSPKNFVQLFRLAHAGVTLFQEGYFPVNVMPFVFGEMLFKLKTRSDGATPRKDSIKIVQRQRRKLSSV